MSDTTLNTSRVLQLDPNDMISTGARECYYHPDNPNLCVKVPLRQSDAAYVLQRELDTYEQVKDALHDFVIPYEHDLVDTNRGLGMVCHVLRNEDGTIAKSLCDYILVGGVTEDMINQIRRFYHVCMQHGLYFYDLNGKNFLIQEYAGEQNVKYIDLKSYRRMQSPLQIDNIFPFLGGMKMRRRMKRLFKHLSPKANVIIK